MMNKTLGTTLLITGTSLGGGMLALPSQTASSGFTHASLFLLFAWAIMTLGALMMVEVNLALPCDNNIISMAQKTLGRSGQIIIWIIYPSLFYALVAAYIDGGSGIIQLLFHAISLPCPPWLGALLFTLLLGSIVWHGIHSMDRVNRWLMAIKLSAYLGLVGFISPHVAPSNLLGGEPTKLFGAMAIMITSFSFAGSIPSFCRYLDYDIKKIRIAILTGSSVTLLCYLLWNGVVQGSVSAQKLTALGNHGNTVLQLTQTLSDIAHNHTIHLFAHLFTSICMLTAFLGVSIGLSDFLADGMRLKKKRHKPIIYGTTFTPPLLIVLFYPHTFITALSYAGIFCLVLLMLMPALMVWQRRYRRTLPSPYQVWGGRLLVAIEIVLALLLITITIVQRIHAAS